MGMLLDGRAQATGIKRPAMDATLLLIINSHHDVVGFTLPEVTGGSVWRCLVDTNLPDPDEAPRVDTGDTYMVTGRSLLLLALEPEGKTSFALRRAAHALRNVAESPTLSFSEESTDAEKPAEPVEVKEPVKEPVKAEAAAAAKPDTKKPV
jgi:glycogen operon protein